MPRFHVEPKLLKNETVWLNKEESRHAISVLRLKKGDTVELFDGEGGVALGVVAEETGGRLMVAVSKNKISRNENPVFVTLAAAVIKPEAMDLLIQKSCELGVSLIQPLITERTVVRLSSERWESKNKRWQKIAAESCKQCGQSRTPRVEPVRRFEDLWPASTGYSHILIPTLAVPGQSLFEALGKASDLSPRLKVFIGPEGDFTEKEASWAASKGATPVYLGDLVLRSETAAFYVLSAIRFFYESKFKVG